MNARRIAAYAAVLGVAACASGPQQSLPRFEPPPAGAAAAEIFSRWDAATAVFHSFSSGDALIATVDGAETPAGAASVRVTPGVHRVAINCLIRTSVVAGTPQHTVVSGPFVAGQKYYARCVPDNPKPRVWLADSPEGISLPQGFTSIS